MSALGVQAKSHDLVHSGLQGPDRARTGRGRQRPNGRTMRPATRRRSPATWPRTCSSRRRRVVRRVRRRRAARQRGGSTCRPALPCGAARTSSRCLTPVRVSAAARGGAPRRRDPGCSCTWSTGASARPSAAAPATRSSLVSVFAGGLTRGAGAPGRRRIAAPPCTVATRESRRPRARECPPGCRVRYPRPGATGPGPPPEGRSRAAPRTR